MATNKTFIGYSPIVLLLHIADYFFNALFESRGIFRKLLFAHGGALFFVIAYCAHTLAEDAAYLVDIADL